MIVSALAAYVAGGLCPRAEVEDTGDMGEHEKLVLLFRRYMRSGSPEDARAFVQLRLARYLQNGEGR